MHEQHARNYAFFDAPVGLIFSIDRDLEQGSWLDYGMFLQSIMVAARAFGLETCPQAAWLIFHDVLQRRLAHPRDADDRVRHGARLRRPERQGEHLHAGPHAGGGFRDVGGGAQGVGWVNPREGGGPTQRIFTRYDHDCVGSSPPLDPTYVLQAFSSSSRAVMMAP